MVYKLLMSYNTWYESFKLISPLLFKGTFQIAAGYEQSLLLFFCRTVSATEKDCQIEEKKGPRHL